MLILVLIIVGMSAGYLLRRIEILKNVNKSITLTICTMLFLLGICVGSNRDLLGNFGNYGWQALLICCAGLAGSILCTLAVNALFFREQGKEGESHE